MILNELFKKYPEEMQDVKQDDSQYKLTDTRKTKLTLGQINRLRKMHDMRKLEKEQELKTIRKMYKAPTGQDSAGIGF